MQVPPAEWLSLIDSEYLENYIGHGGSAIRFALSKNAHQATEMSRGLKHNAERRGYIYALVDASQVKTHLMHDLFHAVAGQVDWVAMARTVVARQYQAEGLELSPDGLQLEHLAAHNQLNIGPLRTQMMRSLEGLLLHRSHELTKDFRYAMLWLCREQLTQTGTDGGLILNWLHGNVSLMSSLKRLLIFQRIGRHNARATLSSLGAWCQLCGYPGLVLQLDIRQLAITQRAEAGSGHFYTPQAAMDAYEVLRQLIDSTDDLRGVLSVVLARPELFDDERRGVKAYKALYERIWPDVSLKVKTNPLSVLVSLS